MGEVKRDTKLLASFRRMKHYTLNKISDIEREEY